MKVTIISIVTGALGTVTKGLVQGVEDLEITERVEIGQNTEKSPEDLRRLVVTQIPVRNHLLTLA